MTQIVLLKYRAVVHIEELLPGLVRQCCELWTTIYDSRHRPGLFRECRPNAFQTLLVRLSSNHSLSSTGRNYVSRIEISVEHLRVSTRTCKLLAQKACYTCMLQLGSCVTVTRFVPQSVQKTDAHLTIWYSTTNPQLLLKLEVTRPRNLEDGIWKIFASESRFCVLSK